MAKPIKSKAAKVLRDPTSTPDERSVAAYVLGDADAERVTEAEPVAVEGSAGDPHGLKALDQAITESAHPTKPNKSLAELQSLLRRIEGQEGQTERAEEVRKQMEALR